MSTLKDVLCLLAIFIAYGLVGHMDYEDAVMLEETQRQMQPSASTECWPTNDSLPGNSAARVRHVWGAPRTDDLSEPAFGPPPEAIALCPPVID